MVATSMISSPTTGRVAFGLYEVDLVAGELWKAGHRIRLQVQPFKVLAALLEHPGEIVTREQLQDRLWGQDTVVGFDHSLGTAVNKVREALGDTATNPRFIETLARRGYRFIAPVRIFDSAEALTLPAAPEQRSATIAAPEATLPEPEATPAEVPRPSTSVPPPAAIETIGMRRGLRAAYWIFASIFAAVLLAGAFVLGTKRAAVRPAHIAQLTRNGHFAPSLLPMENLAAGASDGVHLFATTLDSGSSQLVSINLNDGSVDPVNLPAAVAAPGLGNLSPNGSRLLLRSHPSPEMDQPLWIVPPNGGSALRVGNVLAHDATWMPDGETILFARGDALYTTSNNGLPQLYVTLPKPAFWLRWNPAGTLLRFTMIDPALHTESLWQISAAERTPLPLLQGWQALENECCGVWTADGRHYVFQASQGSASDLWQLEGNSVRSPIAVTDGPLRFQAPVPASQGDRIYFLGVDARSQLSRYDADSATLRPETGFLADAVRVAYSRDAQWVAWTDATGVLWRSRIDGTERLQLTPDALSIFLAQWSPDGTQLAVMAREVGGAWQIFVVPSTGGPLRHLLADRHNAADPSWSADGRSLVFGRPNDVMGNDNPARSLTVINVTSGEMQTVPGSEGLFSPRWSPDGRYIVALSLDQRRMRLFDVAHRTWSSLPVTSAADPVWSPDSKYIYFHASLDPDQPLDRIDVRRQSVQTVVSLSQVTKGNGVDFVFGGLAPGNMPLIRVGSFVGDYYSLTFN